MTDVADVFAAFRSEAVSQAPLRAAITAAYRRLEPECVAPLLELAAARSDEAGRIEALARSLVARLRSKTRSSGLEGLIYEYSLLSQALAPQTPAENVAHSPLSAESRTLVESIRRTQSLILRR